MESKRRAGKEGKWFFILATLAIVCTLAANVLIGKAGFLSTFISFMAAFVYLIVLSVLPNERRISETLLESTLIGACFGGLIVSGIVFSLSYGTGYDRLPDNFAIIICGPVSEEMAKFLSILILTTALRLKWGERLDVTSLGGGVGLGFGILELFGYMFRGVTCMNVVGRLVISVPFHIGSAMLISYGLVTSKRRMQVVAILVAMGAHSLSNYLALYNWFPLLVLSWFLFSTMYLGSRKIVFRSKESCEK